MRNLINSIIQQFNPVNLPQPTSKTEMLKRRYERLIRLREIVISEHDVNNKLRCDRLINELTIRLNQSYTNHFNFN